MVLDVIAAICILGVAFLIRFLIALCEEDASCCQQSLYIVPESVAWETEQHPSAGVSPLVPRAGRSSRIENGAEDEKSSLNARPTVRSEGRQNMYSRSAEQFAQVFGTTTKH